MVAIDTDVASNKTDAGLLPPPGRARFNTKRLEEPSVQRFNTTVRLIIFDPIYESENTLRDEPIVPREKANPLDMAIGMVYGLMNIKKRLRI
ncbi:hypothetical protein HZ326_28879 [Fusarium oxysporum f. sp. albedinis]|nr:hypothetical protein HZ326_28879 [Fusarium oxysporum f. sp. albedinis]